jgi:hypothetical protein
MSFFSRDSDAKSTTTATPMGGRAESPASSFFMKVGRSVFTGGKGRQSEAGASFTADASSNRAPGRPAPD